MVIQPPNFTDGKIPIKSIESKRFNVSPTVTAHVYKENATIEMVDGG